MGSVTEIFMSFPSAIIHLTYPFVVKWRGFYISIHCMHTIQSSYYALAYHIGQTESPYALDAIPMISVSH